MIARDCSEKIYLSSCGVIPGGVSSPVRSFKEVGLSPMVVSEGLHDTIWDVDGNPYIDFCMSWGALILGHANKGVCDRVCQRMLKGSTFGITTEGERDLAQKMVSIVPGVDKVRFVSSGTEAVMSAIRLARGYTGKNVIIKFNGNYHGHVDSLLVQAGSGVSILPEASSKGVPQDLLKYTLSLKYNDTELVEKILSSRDDIAAVIIEPVAANMGVVPADSAFLSLIRDLTKKKGIVLIFDEVITGFRVGVRGSFDKYGIQADLYTFGKIVGGGLPAAAFGGKEEIMDHLAPLGAVYQAGTLSGNPLAIEAGLETIRQLQEPLFYQRLQEKADLFLLPIEQFIKANKLPIQLQRVESMFTFFFSPHPIRCKEDLCFVNEKMFRLFFHEMFHQGIYFSPSQYEANFISDAHSADHLVKTRDCIIRFLMKL
jgi:glutamate-1-semialdehyde 2,1-aminomutase